MRVRNLGRSPVGRRPGRTARRVPVLVGLILSAVLAGCNGASAVAGRQPGPDGVARIAGRVAQRRRRRRTPRSNRRTNRRTSRPPSRRRTRRPARPPRAPRPVARVRASARPRPGRSSPTSPRPCRGRCTARSCPKDWSLEHAEYRLANGGRLTISYRRRSDAARLVLDEGSVCAETTPCVPGGSDLGPIRVQRPPGGPQHDQRRLRGRRRRDREPGLAADRDRDRSEATSASIAAKLRLLDQ